MYIANYHNMFIRITVLYHQLTTEVNHVFMMFVSPLLEMYCALE